MSPLRLYPLIAVAVAAAASVAIYMRRHRKTDAERERERRQLINRTGRITDGTITDVHELTPDGQGAPDGHKVQLIIYSYDVAGVSYEASQDVSHLGQDIDLHAAQLGLPASVKYLPHNPGNSIVIAEGWSGLRG